MAAFSRRHFPARISRLGCLPWLSLLLRGAGQLSLLSRCGDGGEWVSEAPSLGLCRFVAGSLVPAESLPK